MLSTRAPMIHPYSQEDKETLEAPPVYQHDPRTKRQLVEMLRHNPYSDEDREYFMGEDSGADSFLRRAWSNMRRSLGAGPREPTRPFAKRNLFARLAPIPVFMITDWQGEPKFFEPENEFEPTVRVAGISGALNDLFLLNSSERRAIWVFGLDASLAQYCPVFFDHADAEALMYELYTADPRSVHLPFCLRALSPRTSKSSATVRCVCFSLRLAQLVRSDGRRAASFVGSEFGRGADHEQPVSRTTGRGGREAGRAANRHRHRQAQGHLLAVRP